MMTGYWKDIPLAKCSYKVRSIVGWLASADSFSCTDDCGHTINWSLNARSNVSNILDQRACCGPDVAAQTGSSVLAMPLAAIWPR